MQNKLATFCNAVFSPKNSAVVYQKNVTVKLNEIVPVDNHLEGQAVK